MVLELVVKVELQSILLIAGIVFGVMVLVCKSDELVLAKWVLVLAVLSRLLDDDRLDRQPFQSTIVSYHKLPAPSSR
jgi:hypothetical protein